MKDEAVAAGAGQGQRDALDHPAVELQRGHRRIAARRDRQREIALAARLRLVGEGEAAQRLAARAGELEGTRRRRGGRQRDDVLARRSQHEVAVLIRRRPDAAFVFLEAEEDVAKRVEEDEAAVSVEVPGGEFVGADFPDDAIRRCCDGVAADRLVGQELRDCTPVRSPRRRETSSRRSTG